MIKSGYQAKALTRVGRGGGHCFYKACDPLTYFPPASAKYVCLQQVADTVGSPEGKPSAMAYAADGGIVAYRSVQRSALHISFGNAKMPYSTLRFRTAFLHGAA